MFKKLAFAMLALLLVGANTSGAAVYANQVDITENVRWRHIEEGTLRVRLNTILQGIEYFEDNRENWDDIEILIIPVGTTINMLNFRTR